MDRNAGGARSFAQSRIDLRALIDDRGDGGSLRGQREASVPCAVMRRGHHDTPAWQNTVPMQICGHRARQHDAGPVVPGEHQGPLDRARRDHDAIRPDQPQPFSRQIGFRLSPVIGHAFRESDHVVIVPPKCRRPGQNGHATVARGRDPFRRRVSIDADRRPRQQRAAGFRLLIADDHTSAAGGRRRRGGQPGRTGADHQHVAVRVMMEVTIGIGIFRRPAQTAGGSDGGFVDTVPKRCRPHECLIIKPRGQQGRRHPGDRPEIELNRRPRVLCSGVQALIQFDGRGPHIWRHASRAAIDRDEGVRFFRTSRHNPARAMVFERTAHKVNAVRL